MLKRKLHNKDGQQEKSSVPTGKGKTSADIRRQGSGRVDDKIQHEKSPALPQGGMIHDPADRFYKHKSVPPGHGNSPDLLKYYLAQNFASPANLAREANVSRAAVSAVIHGRTRSERIERLIAKSCGRSLQELFPAWYSGGQ